MSINLQSQARIYKPRNGYIAAIQYDGSQEMAEALEERCNGNTYCIWDEEGLFCGLKAMPYYGRWAGDHVYVSAGDLLVWDGLNYILYDKADFETKFIPA
jgi:hypothetical protein